MLASLAFVPEHQCSTKSKFVGGLFKPPKYIFGEDYPPYYSFFETQCMISMYYLNIFGGLTKPSFRPLVENGNIWWLTPPNHLSNLSSTAEHGVIDSFTILMGDFPELSIEITEYFDQNIIGIKVANQSRRVPPFPIRIWNMHTLVLSKLFRKQQFCRRMS